MKIALFADKYVGLQSTAYLTKNYPEHISFIVCTNEESSVFSFLKEISFQNDKILFNADIDTEEMRNKLALSRLDYIILAWWPYIIKERIHSLPKVGTINFHPSLLPHNRGKHYNFWTIVENSPFGVSIHFVDNSIDSGDIIFQKEIEKTWEDTGKTLYYKAQQAMTELFIENYPKLLNGDYTKTKQNLTQGNLHYGRELNIASKIDLDKEYRALDLINLLRARTFEGYPACYFYDNGIEYQIRVKIERINEESN